MADPPRRYRHARVTALQALKEQSNLKDAVALQRVKRLMSDLQSALQPVLAECRLTERAASRAALRQRCCLRHRLAQILEKAKRYTWNCLSGGATRLPMISQAYDITGKSPMIPFQCDIIGPPYDIIGSCDNHRDSL